MKQKRKLPLGDIGSCMGFVALFLAILAVLTLVYVPKWEGLDARLMRNFYTEEENTVDVLMLGSCNMYSSYSPPIAYEQYGISSCVFAAPDQELVTAYHYLIDALKTQDIKVVVLESLFLTCEPTGKREYYNRTAVEYMPMSLNKAQLILELGAMESEYMQQQDSTAPDKLLTYAGYFFPLLRYHGREDVTKDDITFYFDRDDSLTSRGASHQFNYLINDTVNFPKTLNGTEVRETSREYFIKIRDLCEKEGISFLLVKSPNHYRWNDESTQAVRDFAAEQGVDFLDMHTFEDFLVSDYSKTTGRLNVYGMKKFTQHLCEYIEENIPYEPSVLSEADVVRWEKSVETLYANAKKNNMPIDAGQIYRVRNQSSGIALTWNSVPDTSSYSIYRANWGSEEFEKISTVTGETFIDETVKPLQPYTYRIQPNEGTMKGVFSNRKTFVFVEAPKNFTAENSDGAIRLNWEEAEGATSYHLQRKPYINLNYESWDTTKKTTYLNSDCNSGWHYSFRLRAIYKWGEDEYYSAGTIVSVIPLATPKITSVTPRSESVTVSWDKVANAGAFEIYRRVGEKGSFELCDTVSGGKTSYKDTNVQSGTQYFYKIVATKTSYGHSGRSFESEIKSGIAK